MPRGYIFWLWTCAACIGCQGGTPDAEAPVTDNQTWKSSSAGEQLSEFRVAAVYQGPSREGWLEVRPIGDDVYLQPAFLKFVNGRFETGHGAGGTLFGISEQELWSASYNFEECGICPTLSRWDGWRWRPVTLLDTGDHQPAGWFDTWLPGVAFAGYRHPRASSIVLELVYADGRPSRSLPSDIGIWGDVQFTPSHVIVTGQDTAGKDMVEIWQRGVERREVVRPPERCSDRVWVELPNGHLAYVGTSPEQKICGLERVGRSWQSLDLPVGPGSALAYRVDSTGEQWVIVGVADKDHVFRQRRVLRRTSGAWQPVELPTSGGYPWQPADLTLDAAGTLWVIANQEVPCFRYAVLRRGDVSEVCTLNDWSQVACSYSAEPQGCLYND
ncbi:MAG: hypothetical protein AB7K71_22950 [Polyangiaceae bacterium]